MTETRDAKVVFIPLEKVVDMIIGYAKESPGKILPDPIPKFEAVNIEIVRPNPQAPQMMLKATFTFAPQGAKVTVLVGGNNGGVPDPEAQN